MFKKSIAIVTLAMFCLTPTYAEASVGRQTSWAGPAQNLRQDNDAAAAGGIGKALKDGAKATGSAARGAGEIEGAAAGLSDREIDMLAENPKALSDRALRVFYEEDIQLLIRQIVSKLVIEEIIGRDDKIVIEDPAQKEDLIRKIRGFGLTWVSKKEIGKAIDHLLDTKTIRRQPYNTTGTIFHIKNQDEQVKEYLAGIKNTTYEELEKYILQARLNIAKNRRDMVLLRKQKDYKKEEMAKLEDTRQNLEQQLYDAEKRLIAKAVLRAIEDHPDDYLDIGTVKNELGSLDIGPWLRTNRGDIHKVVGDLIRDGAFDETKMQRIEQNRSNEGQFFEKDDPVRFSEAQNRLLTDKKIREKCEALKGTYFATRREALREIAEAGALDSSSVKIETNVISLTDEGISKLAEYIRERLFKFLDTKVVQDIRSRLEQCGYARDMALLIDSVISDKRTEGLIDPQAMQAMLSQKTETVIDLDRKPAETMTSTLNKRSSYVKYWSTEVQNFIKELNTSIEELSLSGIVHISGIDLKSLKLTKRFRYAESTNKIYYAVNKEGAGQLRKDISSIMTNLDTAYKKARGQQSIVDHEITCSADALRDLLGENNTGLNQNLIITSHRGRLKPETEEEIERPDPALQEEILKLRNGITGRPLAGLYERTVLKNIKNRAVEGTSNAASIGEIEKTAVEFEQSFTESGFLEARQAEPNTIANIFYIDSADKQGIATAILASKMSQVSGLPVLIFVKDDAIKKTLWEAVKQWQFDKESIIAVNKQDIDVLLYDMITKFKKLYPELKQVNNYSNYNSIVTITEIGGMQIIDRPIPAESELLTMVKEDMGLTGIDKITNAEIKVYRNALTLAEAI